MIILERNQNENARTYSYRVLLYNITHIEFKPDDVINEKDIADQLNLSRTPVREALMELVNNGLVKIIPQKGSYISKIDYNIIEESRFFRLTIELAILKMACETISDEYITLLNNNIMQQELYTKLENMPALIDLDDQFHETLFKSVNKEWSYNVINSQMAYFNRFRFLSLETLKNETILNQHKTIFNAVKNHDYETASQVMSQHLGQNNKEKEYMLKKYPDYFTTH